MKKVKFKLQNLVFTDKYGLDEHFWMQYRTNSGNRLKHDKIKSCFVLAKNDTVDCFTYFNSLTIRKWKKYTNADEITLNIKIQGNFKIRLFGHYREGSEIKKEWLGKEEEFKCRNVTEISRVIPDKINSDVCGFYIYADSDVEIYGGSYSTFIDENLIKDVNITIATTTFKKEEYIDNNIKILEREFFYSGEEAGQHYFMRIIDNGSTLDPEKYNSEFVHVSPNQNVGGSGGFTRGMLEALDDENNPTHVLLMDDDVKILPESLTRTWTLLSIIKDEYRDHFISGAMLYMEQMNMQHEDVGYVHKDGSYGPRKPILQLHLWDQVFINEEEYEPMPDSYAGWWYCCIPVHTIDAEDLPVPLFIRGDDVEYSVKRHAQFITLGGICIWHKGFANKYNAALELYLVHRNSLIIQSMSEICQDVDFMARIEAFFQKEIRRLNYQSCELLLDAVEDYLNGPEFMMTPQGERIMKEHSAKNEKMTDMYTFGYLGFDLNEACNHLYEPAEISGFKKRWYNKSYNFLLGPNFLLKKETGVIPYDWFEAPAKQFRKINLLVINPIDKTAYLRTRSRRRFLELMKRHKNLMKRYQAEKEKVAAQYKEAGKTLKGQKFWREYLQMQE